MLYETILKRYFEYLKKTYSDKDEFCVDAFKMKELLRHSMCKKLGIKSKSASIRVNTESDRCGNYLFKRINTTTWGYEDKYALVEACIKCLEKAQEKGGKRNV